ncbi:MAG: SurA N-terminal domain-containing protein [Comamonadaceae bacterium]|jgi:peptidyl-prolyl cis-trans isomerase D|nr:SurA N-terminal domain-containing protein [Comamonadaceae bacterium]
MLESIRKHSKFGMILLFLLVIPSFVLVGIDRNYFSESSPIVARVDGHEIKQSDWDNAHRQESDRARAQSPNSDPKLLDTPQARYATLERMVRDRVLTAAVQKMHLGVGDARLAQTLQGIPAIAALRRPDGTLDAEAYRALVGAQGLTPEGFEANMRQDMALSQVLGGVVQSSFSTPAQLNQAMDTLLQRREIQIARFAPQDFSAKVNPTDAELEGFYQAHTAQFQQPEEATVEYLQLDLDAVRAGLTPSEDDLRTYYQENQDRLAGKEERRASHILISAAKDAPAAERAKAKAQADELETALRQDPSQFAALAKKNSQDPGSASAGGDLGFFARGAMVKPFEDAVFGMNKGDVSPVVESDFGYHIITLTDIKKPKTPSFEELRPKLQAELLQQQAQRKFAEVADTFTNSVYEQADSLQPTADKLKLKVQTAQHVTRTPAPGTQGPLANARFLEALFAGDTLDNKRNTEAIEIAPSTLVAGRVVQYAPARTLPYAEVRDRVRALYVADKTAELARTEGQAKLQAWQADPSSASHLASAIVIARNQLQSQPRALVDAALRAPVDKLPAWTGVDLGAQGYAVVKINRIVPREPSPAGETAALQQQFDQWLSTAEGMAYYELLKQRFKAQIKAPRPAP